MISKRILWIFLLVVAGLSLFLTLNLHSRTGVLTYKSEIFADKAGYYSYLPATFIFGWDGDRVPPTLPEATGLGITVTDQDKIFLKYPMGVAIMELPFFLVTHYAIAPLAGDPADGYTAPYHKMIDIAAWVYFLLGCWWMMAVLAEYFEPKTAMASMTLFLLGTNLLYYATVETGMSHIYSFFLAAGLLRWTQVIHRRQQFGAWSGLALGTLAGLLVITRFSNLILLLIPLLWEVSSFEALKGRLKLLLGSQGMRTVGMVPLLVIGLQMTYYMYLSGNPFFYAYTDEGFDFAHPAMLNVWFSPHNGLFLFSPILLFALLGLGRMVQQKIPGGWLGIGIFLCTSFVFASWWAWYFGCAFGARSFVEYFPIYIVALGHCIQWIGTKAKAWRIGLGTLMGLLAILNFKNAYLFKLCYVGNGEWDWSWYADLVLSI